MFILKIIILAHLICDVNPEYNAHDQIQFAYNIEGQYLNCTVHSPLKGWLAVAFNVEDKLKGSNLVMGAAEYGFFKMSDRYIVASGEHKSVLELNVKEALSNRNVVENDNGTTMTFSINRYTSDECHHTLIEGVNYVIVLAASTSDDFSHHSSIRFTKKITLK